MTARLAQPATLVTDPRALPAIDGYWYLASPYTAHPGGIEAAYEAACRAAARLIAAGVPVFAPVAHSHPVATHGGLDPLDHAIWLPADQPMMDGAGGLLVLTLAGWDRSHGVRHEVDAIAGAGRPVQYLCGELGQ